ncbi:MAG: class I SAM-dependent methyltransferase [Oscillospiraceae bacterium]|nr:class I SAM-dependent methyltransferase [Oscillospiraceae bacterium]
MVGILQLAKDRLAQNANESGVYIDFTMGRGRDTLFLCSIAPKGKVYSFDIQPSALEQTAELLRRNNVSNAELILDSHDNFPKYYSGEIDGGLFNLGFLPGGDKSITTQRGSTFSAVKSAMAALKRGCAIGVAVYPGHEEGRLEGEQLQQYFSTIDKKEFDIFIYRLLNVPDSPYMMMIERH